MLKMRTEDEIKAYVDGYNDCYDQFMDCLSNNNLPARAVVIKMALMKEAVNNVVKDNRDGGENDV